VAKGEPPAASTYWLTRFVFLRLLGLVYLFAFLCALHQGLPLIGEHGLLPAQAFLGRVSARFGSPAASAWAVPTLFWAGCSDAALTGVAWAGVFLSLVVVAGFANAPVLAALWVLYMSYVHVGQLFYGYGWEFLLLEAGFLAIFLCPAYRLEPFPRGTPTPVPVVWLLRWLAFRLMLGAGLIKLRGDSCWHDLTCMLYHYETQPIPNPLSRWLHHLPAGFHAAEVLFNHVVELAVPWTVFGPRRIRHLGGLLLVLFQVLLILGGNLSFLNWLTIAVCVACFDDSLLGRLAPAGLAARARTLSAEWAASRARFAVTVLLVALVGILSLNPVANMLSPRQAMNASFDPLDLVNTYGAFGSVGRERPEIVLEGTDDDPSSPDARWQAYELPCKPGDLRRRPCVTSPYHRRLDWQMWFAAMSTAEEEPWLIHLVSQLLRGDRATLGLFSSVPFPDRPPRYVRAVLYRYEFTPPGDESAWWRRTLLGEYLGPLSADDPGLRRYLEAHGWGVSDGRP
jgi:hypothetical protein